jgi:plastocyanin
MTSRTVRAVAGVGALALCVPSATAWASGRDARTHVVEAQDNCDPATFDAELGEGACVGDGDTTFGELFEDLREDGESGAWRFHPDDFTIRHGDHVVVTGEGGEFHTFTEVQEFGGGCVEEINEVLGLEPVEECEDLVDVPGPDGGKVPRGFVETGVAPGGTHPVPDLSRGLHLFECLIHPWMRAEVEVRRR